MNRTNQLDPVIRNNARSLRRELSPAEKILWKELRGRRFTGFRIRRQHPLGEYVLDFYCSAVKLAIELDGESHLDRRRADELRTKWIGSQGITILRFWNTQVFDEKEAVLEAIYRELTSRLRAGDGSNHSEDSVS